METNSACAMAKRYQEGIEVRNKKERPFKKSGPLHRMTRIPLRRASDDCFLRHYDLLDYRVNTRRESGVMTP